MSRALNPAAIHTSAKYRSFARGVRRTDELPEADHRSIRSKWYLVGAAVGGWAAGSAIFHAVYEDQPAPPVTSEIDPAVERLAEMSPFLRQQLADLRAEGWTIGYGAIDSLGATRMKSKTIVINESLKNDPLEATSVLAHEVGHAYPGRFDVEPLSPRSDEDYDDWLERNLWLRRLSEAESELVAAQVRSEIRSGGGPDIGRVEDYTVGLYHAIGAGVLSRDEARERMTEHLDWYSFEYYRSEHEKLWDRQYADTHGPSVERWDRAGSSGPPKMPQPIPETSNPYQ